LTKNPANINILWSELIVGELMRLGVRLFCISPGSRSTPLTIAAASLKGAENVVILDERGAGFYALGYARATRRPAALICTSGTAVANYYPAVIEAYQSRLPMIILSADRPPELRDSGANQTIDQTGIYGSYVNWSTDLPVPDTSVIPQSVLTTTDQAFMRAAGPPGGPVQINCMFREPLEPKPVPVPATYTAGISRWLEHEEPWTAYVPARGIPGNDSLRKIAALLSEGSRNILVIGRTGGPGDLKAVADLARHTGWPVFADITSGFAVNDESIRTIGWYDQLLASETFRNRLNGCRILHLGDPVTSKRYLQYITDMPPGCYIHVQDHARRQDPAHSVTHRIVSGIADFCADLTPLLPSGEKPQELRDIDQRAGQIFTEFIRETDSLSEIGIASEIAAFLPAGSGLYLGSSMPVRDFDMFGRIANPDIRIGSNRGASGIDGSVSSAAGFARGLSAPVTAVIGDVAFIHDMNALDLIRRSDTPLILVIINNNGGGIFSFLPVAGYKSVFETYFATPHNLRFKGVADMFGLDYHLIKEKNDFSSLYRKILNGKKHTIIEVQTRREESFTLHRNLLNRIVEEIDNPGR
jgi:2-succinyl-5-enolpyruvyl-6-hydroxy-3-cyclohexene-1-carboxylate synthase